MIKKLAKKIIGPANLYIIKSWLGMTKNEHLDKKRRAFYSQLVREGDLYFDVGANYGNRIGIMLQLGCKILAIEPQTECCAFLKRMYGSKINIVNKGLGAQAGKKEFFISDSNTLSSFSKDWIDSGKQSGRFKQYNWDKKTMVEMTTLDNLIAQFGKPDFIKIDVEGYEVEVLKGLSTPIRCISFEYTVPEQIQNAVACIEYIQQISAGILTEYNYSEGESMEWASPKWISGDEMIALVQTEKFIASGFGDIYIKAKL